MFIFISAAHKELSREEGNEFGSRLKKSCSWLFCRNLADMYKDSAVANLTLPVGYGAKKHPIMLRQSDTRQSWEDFPRRQLQQILSANCICSSSRFNWNIYTCKLGNIHKKHRLVHSSLREEEKETQWNLTLILILAQITLGFHNMTQSKGGIFSKTQWNPVLTPVLLFHTQSSHWSYQKCFADSLDLIPVWLVWGSAPLAQHLWSCDGWTWLQPNSWSTTLTIV